VLREHLASRAYASRRQLPGNVRLDREDRFRLRAVALDHHGHRLFDAGERLVHQFLAVAARERFSAYAFQPLGERWPQDAILRRGLSRLSRRHRR